jgi:hypothetical protein
MVTVPKIHPIKNSAGNASNDGAGNSSNEDNCRRIFRYAIPNVQCPLVNNTSNSQLVSLVYYGMSLQLLGGSACAIKASNWGESVHFKTHRVEDALLFPERRILMVASCVEC